MSALKAVSLEQKAELDKYFKTENSRSADYCFGNIYMWDKRFNQSVAVCGDRLITLLHRRGERFFAFPVGGGSIVPAFELMESISRENGEKLKISGVCREHFELVNEAFPDKFALIDDRDYADYLYDVTKLASFAGKHLHAKRNYCNRFEAAHEWCFEPLTRANIPDCKAMLTKWLSQSEDRLDDDIEYELDAINRCFESFEALGLEGGALYAEGEIIGFTVGEVISRDTFCIHFEKAFSDIDGAYPMVCREMARQIIKEHPYIHYVNREDDMGNPSLRKSKLSYKPETLLEKFILCEK